MSDFKGRHFRGEIVRWAVRWCCRYVISYRDIEAMMTELRYSDQAESYPGSTSNAVRLRASLLNSTATRWIGSPRWRYLSA